MLGEAIRTIRKTSRLSQEEFARELGVRQNTVSQYENGQTIPSDMVVWKLYGLAEGMPEQKQLLHEYMTRRAAGTPAFLIEKFLEEAKPKLAQMATGARTRQLLGEVTKLVQGVEDVHPALIRILRLYRQHGCDPKIGETLKRIEYFMKLDIEAATTQPGPRRRRKTGR